MIAGYRCVAKRRAVQSIPMPGWMTIEIDDIMTRD